MFEPVPLPGVDLENRFSRSATREGYADDSGHVTEELLHIYERLAKSGLGAIVTGHDYCTIKEEQKSKHLQQESSWKKRTIHA